MKRDVPLKTIGLMGGSFNPAHGGHRAISLFAMDSLGLDEFWWMVSPGNPLKPKSDMAPLPARLASAKAQARRTPIKVTAIERDLGTVYTAESLQKLVARYPKIRFIWIMGADNLAGFHRWQRWQKIATTFPIAVIDRPGSTLSYLSSKMARTFDYARVDEEDAGVLWQKRAPAWTFIHGPRSTLSSSAIRAAAGTVRQ